MTELERVQTMVENARDALTVRRVYGEPIERDGTIVIPAASVLGGAGGGGGVDERGNVGSGGGFGLHARPVGAFVIRDGDVRWEPVVDHDRRQVIAAATTITIALLTLRAVRHKRRKRKR